MYCIESGGRKGDGIKVSNTRIRNKIVTLFDSSNVRLFDGSKFKLSNIRTSKPKTIETKETTGTIETKNKREKTGTTTFLAKRYTGGYPARLPLCIMSSFTEPARGRQGYGGQNEKGGDVAKIQKK